MALPAEVVDEVDVADDVRLVERDHVLVVERAGHPLPRVGTANARGPRAPAPGAVYVGIGAPPERRRTQPSLEHVATVSGAASGLPAFWAHSLAAQRRVAVVSRPSCRS